MAYDPALTGCERNRIEWNEAPYYFTFAAGRYSIPLLHTTLIALITFSVSHDFSSGLFELYLQISARRNASSLSTLPSCL
jgi:hypothetical protein